MAGMEFVPGDINLYPFYVYTPYALVTYQPYLLFSSMMLNFALPLILAFGILDLEYTCRKAAIVNSVIISKGNKIYIEQYIAIFIVSFFIIICSIIFSIRSRSFR